ncbi:uncharacterized protein LOC122512572 [Leptopilina heterotoma]|uniref:uncharacterized protein LOC122512572 n=1 Tax=Leptopilina heterotoma TaxID=63436 RepID=UPI001CA7B99D|nr:uncharacterized protein LOC122512572 [Leptopilina heterotoma]
MNRKLKSTNGPRKHPNYDTILDENDVAVADIKKALQLIPNLSEVNLRRSFIERWIVKCLQLENLLSRILMSMYFTHQKQRCVSILQSIIRLRALFESHIVDGAAIGDPDINKRIRWAECESAFACRLYTNVVLNLAHVDVSSFLDDASIRFQDHIRGALNKNGPILVYSVLIANFKRVENDEEVVKPIPFGTKANSIFPTTLLDDWFKQNIKQPILHTVEEFYAKGSNWNIQSIIRLEINVNKYNPMRASSYIDLPTKIKIKHACINVQNNDNECFKWAVLSALHPNISDPKRVSNFKEFKDELNFDGIEFPVTLKSVPKFEKINDVSINVYGLEKRYGDFSVHPLHLTTEKRDRHVNLLYVADRYGDESDVNNELYDDDDFMNFHYVWIKDLSRLVSKQLSAKNGKKHICDKCLHYFLSVDRLNAHIENCKNVNGCKIKLPGPNNCTIKFKNYKNKERVPYVIYADCESLLLPADKDVDNLSKTQVFQRHKLLSIGYYIKCSYDESLCKYVPCPEHESDPAKWFAEELKKLSEKIHNVFKNPTPINTLTPQEIKDFKRATVCHICQQKIQAREKKARDHSHLTGKYRGAAHESCNLNYQDCQTIPVVFHNLSGYDAHFIIHAISTSFEGKIDLLPINKERYISFTKHVKGSEVKFRFIDSLRFMSESLEKLASYLDEYKIVNSVFASTVTDPDKIKLLTRKGVFPYEYFDSRGKLEETELPPIEKFYSTLYDDGISDHEYAHAQNVWTEFNCKNLYDYVHLYMKTDVLLLADVFENFREQCVNAYGLDPAHYYTTPGLTWDAMLKYTRVELQLITDIDMMMFVESGIRGGISQCCNRYTKANNPYMENFDESKDTSYIMYFDANNLYGWAMAQALPYGGFKWIDNVDDSFNFNVTDNSSVGYILEVDLEYPKSLHDTHKDMPFCAENAKPPLSKQKKLLTTLLPKEKYVIHYRTLKQVVDNGIKLVKIHRVLAFNQSTWLKPYIDNNTTLRTNARNEFEKNFFKLMNNAVNGKTMENVRKHVDIRLVTKWSGRYGAEALISRPNFHSRAIFDENLVAIELRKTEVLLNKPIYAGFSVLDISKTLIYDFHYKYMLKKYAQNCKILYTDTDSLIYEIKCKDVYNDIKNDIQRFDTSDYPENNVYGIPQANKKILGLMKDECKGKIVTEFVGLRSKMYSLRVENKGVENKDSIKKAKGIKSAVIKKSIHFDDYVKCLRDFKIQSRTQYNIRSRLHNIETVEQIKVALNPKDDKRYLLPESTDTLPWGHYAIPESTNDL